MAVEYVLIVILIALGTIFVVGRFGGALRGKTRQATEQVERTGVGGGAQPEVAPVGEGVAPAPVEVPDDAVVTASRVRPQEIAVMGLRLDLQTAIWLAVLVVVLGSLMVMQVAKGARKKPKKERA
jgi:Flp pilus assembly pilin Flp